MTTPIVWAKDPTEVLDYPFDWAGKHLAEGETISSYTVTVPDGITVDSDDEDGGVVTVWLSGGTAGTRYPINCRIVTTQGRTIERTKSVTVRNR